jgi:diguanylate cyclase (GGDEF)-like protein
MQELATLAKKNLPIIFSLLTFTVYVIVFAAYHHRAGIGIAALATIPVLGAGWYFGAPGGVLTALVSILANVAILLAEPHDHPELLANPGSLAGALTLILIGAVIGKIGTVSRERREAMHKLEVYERERRAHTRFLEQLNSITGRALEADSLVSTLQILTEQIAGLFEANDSFLTLWDAEREVPIPTAAYGSMSDIYPSIRFEPGEQIPTTFALEHGEPIAIADLENSPLVDPKIAAMYPSHSMLIIPLVAQNRKLGSVLLGFSKGRAFEQAEMERARIAAEQIALILFKSLLLEEERKQVKQLTALHDIALISINADDEDELILRVTDVIGRNLFLDNFGILLLDEQAEILHAHPSYRFFSSSERHMMDIPLGLGITGQVARTGRPLRIGDVTRAAEYLNVDERTISELCVPIKFKEQILGVINAESTKKDAFTEDDERLLVTLAGQIATTLEQIRRTQAERKWLDQLAHSNGLIYALAQITTHIERAFSTDDIIRNLGAELHKINLTCIMAIYDKERGLFTVNYTSLDPEFLKMIEDSIGYPLITYTFSRDRLDLAKISSPAALPGLEEEIGVLLPRARRHGISDLLKKIDMGPVAHLLRLPLVFEETLLGILWIWGKDLTGTDLPIMSIFAKQVGVSLERARLFQEVQSLALTDPLTGLQNRRSLFELGRVEFARAQRMDRPFCCMMLDLDHFKQINDTYGHPVGDQVLREFAYRCKASVRDIDLIGRYGGEELIILLPETDWETAMQVAERLRATVAAEPIRTADMDIAVTVSIGVATKDENTTQLETLIARADQAMYIAKHKGRNRVAMSK